MSLVQTWNSTFLLSCKRGVRIPVELKLGNRAFLELQQGSQTSLHVVRRYAGFHSRW